MVFDSKRTLVPCLDVRNGRTLEPSGIQGLKYPCDPLEISTMFDYYFVAQVEEVLANGSANDLMNAARAGRVSYGEATVSAFELLNSKNREA